MIAQSRAETLRCLCLWAGVAFAYRLFFLLAMPRVLDTADGIHYLESAAKLARGNLWDIDPKIPVLYPALGALVSMFVPDFEQACTAVSFVASVLLVVPVFLLARDLFGKGPAPVAALCVSIWPWLADYGCRVGPEALGVLLWFSGVLLLSRGIRGSLPCLLGAVLSFFALHLTRPEGTFILLAAIPAAFILAPTWDRAFVRKLAIYTVSACVLLLATALFTRSLSGELTANYRTGFILQEFDWARFADTALKTLSEVFPIMLGPVLLVFLGAGFFLGQAGSATQRDTVAEWYLLFFVFSQWFVSLFVLSPAPRYLMAPLVALALWSSRGIWLVGLQATQLRYASLLKWLPTAALVSTMLLHTGITVGAEHLGRRPREPREYKAAGLWMKANLEPGVIFTRKPQIGYYAGMPSTGPASGEDLETTIARARAAQARYLVVDERYTPQTAPALAPLLDETLAPPELRPLHTFDLYPESRVVVYELLPAAP